MATYKPADVISASPYTGVRPKLRYQRITQGAGIPLFDRPIKPGQFFQAYPEEIPEKLAHHFVCVDGEKLQQLAKKVEKIVEEKIVEVIKGKKRVRTVKKVETIPQVENLYEVSFNKKTDSYNVINHISKKILNEELLSLEEAKTLCDSLNI